MATIPTPRSFNEILGDMVDAFLSRSGLGALKTGTPVLSALEATAQSQLRSSEDIFTLLESGSLDQASGLALDRIGADESLPRITESPASGLVNITDTSFDKISSKVFQGTPAPIIGSVNINVTDASLFTATGSIYLGRGTNNYEGPLAYTSILPPGVGGGFSGGSYYTLVLSSGTQRFHNVGESVVLAQGGTRAVSAGSIVQTPQGNAVAAVAFRTMFLASIPDGETSIEGVQVVAQKPGTIGNVPAGAISAFSPEPFTGATVTNPLPFTNGLPSEDDESYRERIRAARQSRSRGTALALETAAVGVTSSDENKRVLSASVVAGSPTVLYIDDGTGYEERDEGVAIEFITDYASGGEDFFRVSALRPIAKAFVLTSLTSPFALSTGEKLAVLVGGVLTEHTFDSDEFLSIENASAYEVVASINSNPALLWSARTYANGTQVAVFAKAEYNESVQVITPNGDDANDALGFSTNRVDTLRLYQNDRLLSKDGALASIESNPTGLWATLTGDQTLVISVDGHELSFDGTQFDSFTAQEFVDADTGFTTMGVNTPEAWAKVFTARIPGVTAAAVAGRVVLTSNRGRASTASIEIISGTLVTNSMFDTDAAVGDDNDYTLDRNTGELKLTSQLLAGDRLTAGSEATRAFLETGTLGLIAITDAKLWFAVDSEATRVLSALTASTPLSFTVSSGEVQSWGFRARVSSTTTANLFGNVLPGDWAVFWDPSSPTGVGEYRVSTVSSDGQMFEIDVRQDIAGRYDHRVTALGANLFLITGGYVGPNAQRTGTDSTFPSLISNTAISYNATTGAVTVAANMSQPRAGHTATLLADGRVLVAGGQTSQFTITDTCEIYDPGTNTWVAADNLNTGRAHHEAVLLNDNTVLVAGGTTAFGSPDTVTNTSEIYTPAGNTWAASGNLAAARRNFAMAKFTTSGNVTIAGGETGAAVLASLERWVAGVWSNIGNLNGGARRHLRAAAASGTVVRFTGGSTSLSSLDDLPVTSHETYTDGGAIAAAAVMGFARARHGMAALSTGDIVVHGGVAPGADPTGRPQLFSGGAWSSLAFPLSRFNAMTGGNRYGNHLGVLADNSFFTSGGQCEANFPWNAACIETFDNTSSLWQTRHPFLTASVSFGSIGLQFVRTNSQLQRVEVPTGTNYTAPTLAVAIADRLVGATTEVYRTTTLRVRTNTFGAVEDVQENILAGDIGLLAQNTNAALIDLDVADATLNLTGHMASVEAGNYEMGTPDFHQSALIASTSTSVLQYAWSGDALDYGLQDQVDWIISNLVVGLRTHDDWLDTETIVGAPEWTRFGGIQHFVSALKSRTEIGDSSANADVLELRNANVMGFVPQDRFYLASPYQLGSEDQLTVLVDGDVEQKRFTIPMWRTLTTVGNVYASTNTFLDGDNADLTLATAFGYTGGPIDPFEFEDFAVFMPARQKAYTDVALSSILWRYYRLGPDGNAARTRFVYPAAPDSALTVAADPHSNDFTNHVTNVDIDITLGSGPLRTGYGINSLTKIGEVSPSSGSNLATIFYIFAFPIASAQRVANVTTLTLTLPAGVTPHGLTNGATYNVVSTSGSFSSGDKVLTAVAATTISYSEVDADAGPIANIGRVYLGAGQTGDISGAAVAQHDFFRLETAASTNTAYEGFTTRIVNDPVANPYWIEGRVPWYTSWVTSTTPAYYTLGDSTAFKIFQNLQQTATAIVTAVNALTNCPITGKNLDAGSGLIVKSTADMALNGAWRDELVDGVNYVKITTPAGSAVGNYQLTFKNDIYAALAANADWENETVRVVPRTAKNVAEWLSAGAVSGLYTVASAERSSRGHKVQLSSLMAGSDGSIQVQGGTANSATAPVVGSAIALTNYTMYSQIAAADTLGLFAGQYVAVDNTISLPKAGVFTSVSILLYLRLLTDAAQYSLDTQVYTERSAKSENAVLRIEKQGRFVCYTSTYHGTPPDTTGVLEGDWVRVSGVLAAASLTAPYQINAVNQGIFRVVRVVKSGVSINSTYESVDGGYSISFWVENDNAVDQTAAECDVHFFTPDSMLPGDSITVSSDLWGAGNRGSWDITSVGSSAFTVPVGGLVRAANVVTVTMPNTSPVNQHNLGVGDYFDLSPGEASFPEGRYVVATVTDAYIFTYAHVAANATSAGQQNIVGLPFQNPNLFQVDNTTNVSTQVSATAPMLGSSSPLFQCFEGEAGRYIKQIQTISPNATDATLADIKFNTSERNSQVSEAAGSIISALDKLDFPTTLAQGLDGYKHAIGLIGEVNRVIYGDPDDPATYPGVAAAGATVNIQGPLIKRVQVSLAVRVRSGAPKQDIEDRVKSAVAAVINAAGVGESISISSVINAASAVPGVVAITPISPALTTGTDLITVQAYEKPLVLNLDQDITVSFIGE